MTTSNENSLIDSDTAARKAYASNELRSNAALLRAAATLIMNAPLGSKLDYFEDIHKQRKFRSFSGLLKEHTREEKSEQDIFEYAEIIIKDSTDIKLLPYELKVSRIAIDNYHNYETRDANAEVLQRLSWSLDISAAAIEDRTE
jgi:hypothetical protein